MKTTCTNQTATIKALSDNDKQEIRTWRVKTFESTRINNNNNILVNMTLAIVN